MALEATEQKTGIIQPQGQAQAVIATIMQLQAQISARQVDRYGDAVPFGVGAGISYVPSMSDCRGQ